MFYYVINSFHQRAIQPPVALLYIREMEIGIVPAIEDIVAGPFVALSSAMFARYIYEEALHRLSENSAMQAAEVTPGDEYEASKYYHAWRELLAVPSALDDLRLRAESDSQAAEALALIDGAQPEPIDFDRPLCPECQCTTGYGACMCDLLQPPVAQTN